MKRPRRRTNFFHASATLPPRFVAAWFSDESVDVEITTDTIRDWRKAGYFGPRAQRSGRYRLSWQELLVACRAWSPTGSVTEMQRKPYTSEAIAVRLGLDHRTALDRFRKRKIPGAFKMGIYWYARAAEFDASL